MVSLAVPAQHAVVPEASSHLVSLTGLTESSSSSKLTFADVCSLMYLLHKLCGLW
jgi:hypothetical protein